MPFSSLPGMERSRAVGFTFWRCEMPKRSEKRDTAKAEYIAKKKKGEEVSLRALAGELGVSYQTLRNWKAADKWEEALPKKKRGGQPGNQNSKGKGTVAHSRSIIFCKFGNKVLGF